MANNKDNPRTQIITFRVTEEEKKMLKQIAGATPLSEMMWRVCQDLIQQQKGEQK